MASLQTTIQLSSSFNNINAAIHLPKLSRLPFSLPQIPSTKQLLHDSNQSIQTIPLHNNNANISTKPLQVLFDIPMIHSKATIQLYAILEAVSDRIEMHKNIGEQRDNWNTLLLNSINMITLAATTMAGVAGSTVAEGAPLLALKLSSGLLFTAAAGMLLIMNKIQPSQLAEEQRNAVRLFKQLRSQIKTKISLENPTDEDVKDSMAKVLALDKAYPLPLLGAMIEKFPAKFEPSVWWPSSPTKIKSQPKRSIKMNKNGWSEELEMELREVIEVIKKKDIEDYERLGNLALKINKSLAIAGPLLTGIAAVGSAFVGNGSWACLVPVMAGSLAAAINAFEHGGQVGMVFEMYKNCGGFFQLLEETVKKTLEEKDLEKRENGELFEMKMALQLGRSVSQLRELASKSASNRMEGISSMDEFASKLF